MRPRAGQRRRCCRGLSPRALVNIAGWSWHLRNNLKWLSFGHLNVMRVEVLQLLEEAFKILDAEDVKRLFGADNAWDVVEEVLIRYYNERLVTSPRFRPGARSAELPAVHDGHRVSAETVHAVVSFFHLA